MDINNRNTLPLEDVLVSLKNISGRINREDKMKAAMMIGSPGNPMSLRNIDRYLKGEVTGKKDCSEEQARMLLDIFTICVEGTNIRTDFLETNFQKLQLI
jgi:hypothetical protein